MKTTTRGRVQLLKIVTPDGKAIYAEPKPELILSFSGELIRAAGYSAELVEMVEVDEKD